MTDFRDKLWNYDRLRTDDERGRKAEGIRDDGLFEIDADDMRRKRNG